ncbi:diguanylate cyclase [Aquabacterium sp. OR-4]|uniref:diguanylate cyclase n=1 Tax=Aquabacterium sp. OR-4 TaxID=2978127 RepID=UPI0028C73BB2|nr:diguanylate cyclase [Aquabacterium sp. OR-4]MDT7838003.1 diguanylate cyclase [Aquabacterium sp. OR-4]
MGSRLGGAQRPVAAARGPRQRSGWAWWLTWCCGWPLLWALLAPAAAGAPAQQPPLQLLPQPSGSLSLWPAVRWLHDPSGQLDLDAVRDGGAMFVPPPMASGTLGLQRGAAWLMVALQVPPGGGGQWVLESEQPSVQHLAFYLLDDAGQLLLQARLGSLERQHGRVPTAQLELQPGRSYQLLLRAQSESPLILPLRLSRPGPYIDRTLAAQSLQALLTGLSLALLAYSLGQAWWHRDRLSLRYAFLVASSMTVSLAQFGLAAQFLWPGHDWALRHGAGLAALLAQCASFLYNEAVLRHQPGWRGFSTTMRAGALVMLATALLFATDLIGVAGLSAVAGTVGMMPALLGLSRAWALLRQRDATGAYLLLAWLGYYLGIFTLMAVSYGRLPATPWTLHAFQLAAVFDLLLFLQVLVLRQRQRLARAEQQVALQAGQAAHLRNLAETDVLTGLPNRRGLEALLPPMLARAQAGHGLALYMIDLDGFKAINDTHGHAMGDRLLRAMADRLRQHIRQHDVLARLGGDEFVLVAEGLQHSVQAQELGQKLLQALQAPLLPEHSGLALSLTAGCAFAEHATAPDKLLRRADLAMYRGKQAGRGRVEVDCLSATLF